MYKKCSSRLAKPDKPQPTLHTRAESACILCRVARRKSHLRGLIYFCVNEDLEGKRNAGIRFLVILLCFFSYPIICITEYLNPWCNIISQVVSRICCTLPWEDSTLGVRHHCNVTAVCACKSSYVVV